MIRNRDFGFMALALGAWALPMLAPAAAHAQLWTWTREQMIEYTPAWTGERFADGRPKVSDGLLERARGLSNEEVMINWGAPSGPGAAPGGRGGGAGGAGGGRGSPYSQYTDGWQVLHPNKKMVGRALTVAFMPARPDLDAVVNAKARARGIDRLGNQTVIDMLQPGDVLVVDLYGKKEGGTIVGDNLFHYIMRTTKSAGLVVDGGIRDLEGIMEMDMPAYYRSVHPSAIGGVSVAAVNVPIRIGNVTVMPGDVVIGDPEGVSFVPPQFIEGMVDLADTTHIHDEWTRKKFDEGKYKSQDIYGSPRDPALLKEYQEYLKKRLEEIRKNSPK
ncbi:MAG: dimethylmenaquinone methyltransferase [Bryobacteraceae bacterium]|jgi:regulator of RNase E activity RraA